MSPWRIVTLKRELRAYALKHHLVLPKGFRREVGYVGIYCRQLIRETQRHAFGPKGVTGEFDSRTQALLDPPIASLGDRALTRGLRFAGVHEEPMGSNTGPLVHFFQTSTNAFGEPWCASFFTKMLQLEGWRERGWNQAYVPSWSDVIIAGLHGCHRQSNPVRGSGVIYKWSFDTKPDHMEFFIEWIEPGLRFRALGGNVGDAVRISERSIHDVVMFFEVA